MDVVAVVVVAVAVVRVAVVVVVDVGSSVREADVFSLNKGVES